MKIVAETGSNFRAGDVLQSDKRSAIFQIDHSQPGNNRWTSAHLMLMDGSIICPAIGMEASLRGVAGRCDTLKRLFVSMIQTKAEPGGRHPA